MADSRARDVSGMDSPVSPRDPMDSVPDSGNGWKPPKGPRFLLLYLHYCWKQNYWRGLASYSAYKRIETMRTRPPSPPEPLWADFSEAAIRSDVDRLAAISQHVLDGVPIEMFNLTENERLVVDYSTDAKANPALGDES